MITLLLRVHTTYIWVQFFAHIPFVVNHAFNVTPKKWQQNHALQNFCTNWIVAREGSTDADVSFAANIYITLVMITAQSVTHQRPVWVSDEFFHGVAEKIVPLPGGQQG